MKAMLQDVRYGARMLLKKPGFTFIAVITLALGIGANTAIFSVVNSLLLRPLSYKAPDRLVWWWETQPQLDRAPFSAGDFLDFQSQNQTFEEVAAIRTTSLTITGEGLPEQIRSAIVSVNYFTLLGAEPQLGRALQPDDGRKGAPRVAIISYGLWQKRFGGDPNILGRVMRLSGEDVPIAGVMPRGFKNPLQETEIWVNPHMTVPDFLFAFRRDNQGENRGSHYLQVVGRLKQGVTLGEAQADIDSIFDRIHQQFPVTANHGVNLVPLHERVTGQMQPALLVLLGAVGIVLLMACVNVANLLLSRATARAKEVAIRTALGASRWRIVRQMLTESFLLAVIGGVAGLMLAIWGVDALVSFIPADTPRLDEVTVDLPVFAFTLIVSLVTGVLFGMAPALSVSRIDINETLKEGARGSTSAAHNRMRSALVIAEVALALVVLAGAGLLVKSFIRLQSVEPGFNPENLLTMRMWQMDPKYQEADARRNFLKELAAKLEAIPGVEGVGISSDLPVQETDTSSTPTIEGRPPAQPGEEILVGLHPVNVRYFDAMGIKLLSGRAFAERDDENATPVVIVNQTMAERLWPGQDPVGKRLTFGPTSAPNFRWSEVIGVAADIKHDGLHVEPRMHAYLSNLQNPWPIQAIAIRSQMDEAALMAAVRQSVQTIDPAQPVYEVKPMSDVFAQSVADRRLVLVLFVLFAVVALTLSAVGIYGVVAYMVAQRTHEIGVRMALGAQRSDILRLVFKQGMLLAFVGAVIGIGAAVAATRLIKSLLYEVSATDPMTLGLIAALLGAVALLACYIPARRAMKVDPMVALRYE